MFWYGINIIFHTREKCVIYGAILRVYKSLQSKQIPTLNPLNIERAPVQNPQDKDIYNYKILCLCVRESHHVT